MYTICTHSHKNRRVVSILSTTAILAVLSDVKIVLEQVKQIQATDTSLSSTAVDILPITNSIITDHSLFSVRQEADVPVDNVWV